MSKVKAYQQVGDITNFNSAEEWKTARKIFTKLEYQVNYILCTGNHYNGEDGICNSRDTEFSKYFDYTTNTDYISSFEENRYENSCFQINIHNQTYQLFTIEFRPKDRIISLAYSIPKQFVTRPL